MGKIDFDDLQLLELDAANIMRLKARSHAAATVLNAEANATKLKQLTTQLLWR